MKADRNEPVKWTFNKLRHDCASRGVTWADVDLRWGIPTERAAEPGALPICLAEIEKCRPFFIGLLGDRYGYVPEHIPAVVLDAHPWIREHDCASITELEIWCGVLNDPARAPYPRSTSGARRPSRRWTRQYGRISRSVSTSGGRVSRR